MHKKLLLAFGVLLLLMLTQGFAAATVTINTEPGYYSSPVTIDFNVTDANTDYLDVNVTALVYLSITTDNNTYLVAGDGNILNPTGETYNGAPATLSCITAVDTTQNTNCTASVTTTGIRDGNYFIDVNVYAWSAIQTLQYIANGTSTYSINNDNNAPTSTISVLNKYITMSCVDNDTNASGCATSYYKCSESSYQTYSASTEIFGTSCTYYSVDNAGNSETIRTYNILVMGASSCTMLSLAALIVFASIVLLAVFGMAATGKGLDVAFIVRAVLIAAVAGVVMYTVLGTACASFV